MNRRSTYAPAGIRGYRARIAIRLTLEGLAVTAGLITVSLAPLALIGR